MKFKNKLKSWLKKIPASLSKGPRNRRELIELLKHAKNNELIDQDGLTMIEGVLTVSEKCACDVMIPRPNMTFIAGEQTPQAVLPIITKSGHSRFPVAVDTKEKVIGILLAKDLLKVIGDDQNKNIQIQKLVRPAKIIPEKKRLDSLLKEFRETRNHMAIVIDEYGQIAGLVTIEDILEEIVGEIEDEHDLNQPAPFIQKTDDTSYTLSALTPVEEFNDFFNCNYTHKDFDTVGGLLLKHFGHLPKKRESITIDQFDFVILKAKKRSIEKIKVSINNKRTVP